METVVCNICEGSDTRRAALFVRRDEYASRIGHTGRRSTWVLCRTCGLVFQNARPDQSDVSRLYARGVYREGDDNASVNQDFLAFSLRRPIEAIAWLYQQPEFCRIASRGQPARMIDIGSGIGGALSRFKERGWDVLGVEPDVRCAEIAEQHFGAPTWRAFLTEDSLPPGDFDFAFSQHAFEHIRDPLAVARAARKLLDARQGLLFICVPTYRRTYTYSWEYFNTAHTYIFTHSTLGNLLARAGFTVLAYRYFAEWAREGEIWILGRADRAGAGPDPSGLPFKENILLAQTELALAPLMASAALAPRLMRGVISMLTNPSGFYTRSPRMRLLIENPRRFAAKAVHRAQRAARVLRLQFSRDDSRD